MSLYISKSTSNIAKGIFCLFCIVLHHASEYLFDNRYSYITYVLVAIGMFGFLFLSGYGCHRSWASNGRDGFWDRKILKLYIPAMMVNVIGVAVCLAFGYRMGRVEIFEAVVTLSPYFDCNGYLWYMRYLLVWYIIFWLINVLICNNTAKNILFFIAMLVMWFTCSQIHYMAWANVYGFAYVFGIYYSQIADKFKKVRRSYIIGIVVAVMAVLGIAFATQISTYDVTILGRKVNFWVETSIYNVIAMLGMILILIISRLIARSVIERGFTWLGCISYLIYILHKPLIIFPMSQLAGIVNPWFIFISGGAATMLVATWYVRKIQPKIIQKSCKADVRD